MSTNKGLGRGFDALIPSDFAEDSFDPMFGAAANTSDLRTILLDQIQPDGNQPRRHFDEASLEELSQSIREHGVLQPIVVRPHEGNFMIVAGERRWRASRRAGLTKIPALVRTPSAQQKLELSLIENLQRQELSAIETAGAYLILRDQFNLTLEQIGQRVGGKSVSTISNTMRLLRLPESVRAAIADGRLKEGQARPLVDVDNELTERILPRIISEGWSSRAIEQYIAQLKSVPRGNTKPSLINPLTYKSDTKKLENRLHAPVVIRATAKGSGQIVIRFRDQKDFERINNLLDK